MAFAMCSASFFRLSYELQQDIPQTTEGPTTRIHEIIWIGGWNVGENWPSTSVSLSTITKHFSEANWHLQPTCWTRMHPEATEMTRQTYWLLIEMANRSIACVQKYQARMPCQWLASKMFPPIPWKHTLKAYPSQYGRARTSKNGY